MKATAVASVAVPLALGFAWARWHFGPGFARETNNRMSTPLQPFEREFIANHVRKQQEESGFITRPRAKDHAKIRIFYRFWFPKQPKVRGVVLAFHGMGDHSGNSNQFYGALLEKGLVVGGMDYEGHGRSQGRHGFFSDFDDLVDDAIAFIELTKAKFADQKLFLMGRSLGGLLVLHVLLKMGIHAKRIDGVVIQYPALTLGDRPSPLVEWMGRCLRALVPKLVILPRTEDKSNSLETQQRVQEIMQRDALHYKGGIRIGTGLAIADAMVRIKLDAPASQLLQALDRPMLLQHGTNDQLCPIAGSQKLLEKCSSLRDKTFKEYLDAGHDLSYDAVYAQCVMDDCCNWLEMRL